MVLNLLKARLAATISGIGRNAKKAGAKKRGIGFKVFIGILLIYIVACFFFLFGSIFGSISSAFNELGLDWLYYAIAGIMAFALCFIGSVFMAQHQIFEAKDNELLLSMPIKPSAILVSRVLAIYVFNLVYTLAVMLPAVIIRWISFGASAAEVIIVVLEILLIPVMSMAVSCIFGWLIALISSRMRNKNAITLVLSVAFLVAYFYVCTKMGDYINILAQNGASIAETVRKAVFPAYHMGIAAANGSVSSFLIFLACAVVPFAIVFFAISRNFASIVSTKVGAPKVKYVEKRLHTKGTGSALLAKEIKRFTGSAMYMLNGGLGTLFMLIVAVMLIVKKESLFDIFAIYGIKAVGVAVIVLLLTVCASMNIISGSSISLEARTMWIAKSLPVDTFTVLLSKAACHFIFSAGGALIAAIVACFVLKPTVAELAALLLLPIIFSALTAAADLLINLHMPKFDWINEVACIKQSGSVIVAMFVNLAVAALPIVLYLIVLSKYMSLITFIYAALVFYAVATVILIVRLKTKGVKIFNEL